MPTRLLVLVDWFDPAFKAGGPIRSVTNLVHWLEDDLEIFILTSAYDLHETVPMPIIQTDAWVDYGKRTKVFYATQKNMHYAGMKRIIQDVDPSVIYLNGIFSKIFVLFPLWMHRSGLLNAKMVLAPRGMLKNTALAFKPLKKKVFLNVASLFTLFKEVSFQATDAQEVLDIHNYMGHVPIRKLSNLPPKITPASQHLSKASGQLHLIFVGRIHPIKNLDLLLESLTEIDGMVTLTICGLIEDQVYHAACLAIIEKLPQHVTVKFVGEKKHDDLLKLMAAHHALALPTKGENFGHAIFEMLSLGRPVLISDQTPWRNLQAHHVGFDLPLNEPSSFSDALQSMVHWHQQDWDEYVDASIEFSKKHLDTNQLRSGYLKLFTETT